VHTALSLFSGCGGFCEGIETAGFEVRAAVEADPFACETYRFNFPRTPLFEGDIHGFLAPGTDHARKYRLDGVDLVFGGPPCQGYSQIGTRRLDDERNQLYREFLRIVEVLRPRVFLMENVPNLALMNGGHFRRLILKDCAAAGYSNSTMLNVSAADYGVPQARQRVIFVGSRDGDRPFPYELKSFCQAALADREVKRHATVREAIGDLPAAVVPSGKTMDYPAVSRPGQYMRMMRMDYDGGWYRRSVKRRRGIGAGPLLLHNHHTKEIQERRKRLIALLAPGMKADSLPREVWDGKRPEKWRRLHPEQPSYTILAQMHRDLSEWVHPWLERWITVREAARLQSFHDGFIFKSSEWQQLKQIGNAVPPLLAHVLGGLVQDIMTAAAQGAGPPLAQRKRPAVEIQQLLPV
jgi:DNA (cytosine-5)-methyltransferase 1